MNKIFDRILPWVGVLTLLVLAACNSSPTPESPQQAVEEASDRLSLAGTAWELEFFGKPDDGLTVQAGTQLTVNYFVGRYTGSGGCIWYLGVYNADSNNLLMETPARTRLLCEPSEIMVQEGTFMDSLLAITSYEMEGEKLVGYTGGDQRLLTFVPAQLAPFDETTWNLKLMREGKDLVSIISGSTVTAQFQGDQMSGSGGCNTYNATVNVSGDTLTISDAASTEMACSEPERVLEQETKYLAALQSVAKYTLAGQTLILLDNNDQVVLLFGAV